MKPREGKELLEILVLVIAGLLSVLILNWIGFDWDSWIHYKFPLK